MSSSLCTVFSLTWVLTWVLYTKTGSAMQHHSWSKCSSIKSSTSGTGSENIDSDRHQLEHKRPFFVWCLQTSQQKEIPVQT
eukprot:scaffold125886_cov24-Tisochrysis_lutea.AAC.1